MILEEMQKRHEQYNRDLIEKMDLLEVKKADLKVLKDALIVCENEQSQLIESDQSLRLKMEEIDQQVLLCDNEIRLAKTKKESFQEEYERLFILAFGKKNELKKQIEKNGMNIEQVTQKRLFFLEEKKKLEEKRNLVQIDATEEHISQLQNTISEAEKDITDLENSIAVLKKALENIDDKIATEEQARLEAESVEAQVSLESEQIKQVDLLLSTYEDIYGLVAEEYESIKVETLGFSVRLRGRLLSKGYKTVGALLKSNDDTLRKIRGFGQGCIDELHNYLKTLVGAPKPSAVTPVVFSGLTEALIPYKEQILYGDFSFLNSLDIGSKSKKIIQRFKEAHDLLDFELVEELVNGSPTVYLIIDMLQTYSHSIDMKKESENVLRTIPAKRTELRAEWLIEGLIDDSYGKEKLEASLNGDHQTLEEYLRSNAELIGKKDRLMMKFITSCQYDLRAEINHFFLDLLNDRERLVICERATGKTLDAIGTFLNVSRERIRQIEKKVVKNFAAWQKRNHIIFKIFVELQEEVSLSSMEIISFLGQFGQEMVYLMKNCENDDVIYDKQLDMFVAEDCSISEKIQAYVESLPETFNESKMEDFVRIAEEDYEYPSKMIVAAVEENYNKTDSVYHRSRLTLTGIYADILERFYPNGIHVYDERAIMHFRNLVYQEYGRDISGKSDHAIGSILARIGILCGRGIYKLQRDKTYMSKGLAKKIYDYVTGSPMPIFMTNTLFNVFEDELIAEGIDNKYFLQGILRALYEDEWIFRRDYISKDESYTSVYSSIVDFIKSSAYPITKEDIYTAFPGVSDIVINFSVSDPNILNLFGKYIHCSHLKLSDQDIEYLHDIVEEALRNKDVCNCHDLYDFIGVDYPELLKNNYVNYAFSLYSLLEHLFRDHYNFSRPFVARENAEIERGIDVLKAIVTESELVEIADIRAFAREHRVIIYSILNFIDSCNDTHILVNDMEIASINYTGMTQEIAIDIEKKILEEIDGTIPIHQLQCIHSLPPINVEWNAWLIYSVLKKWATRLEVGVSESQFRHAYPLVAPIGKLEVSNSTEVVGEHDGKLVMADDLAKIDDLVGNILSEELEGFDGL